MPGIMVGLALALVIFILSRNPGRKWVIHDWQGWRHVWSKLKSAAFSIVAPFLTFVSIAAGVATATESASLIIMVVTLVGIFIYKKIKLKAFNSDDNPVGRNERSDTDYRSDGRCYGLGSGDRTDTHNHL